MELTVVILSTCALFYGLCLSHITKSEWREFFTVSRRLGPDNETFDL